MLWPNSGWGKETPIALADGVLTPAWASLPPHRRRELVDRYVQRATPGPASGQPPPDTTVPSRYRLEN